jgi:hypothetical protein
LEELGCRDCQTKWLALGVVSDVGRWNLVMKWMQN